MKYLNDQYRVNMKDFHVRFRKKFEVKIFLPTCSDCEWNEICYISRLFCMEIEYSGQRLEIKNRRSEKESRR